MARLLYGKGARGAAVEDIQRALRFEERDIDGSYGNQTAAAVMDFQRERGFEATGSVDVTAWTALVNRPVPPIFERALALTAAFEGHGFSLAQGNFDGAGITWGIIGFTLKHGGISKIVEAIQERRADLIELAFENQTARLRKILRAPVAEQIAFADSVSIGPSKVRLAEPWRGAFDLFGRLPEVREEQLRLARRDYFQPAVLTAADFGLRTELGLALAFDIHVQNGGIKPAAAAAIQSGRTPANEKELRRRIANAVADSARLRYRDDVRSRKLALAEGTGLVHGERFTVKNWGLDEIAI